MGGRYGVRGAVGWLYMVVLVLGTAERVGLHPEVSFPSAIFNRKLGEVGNCLQGTYVLVVPG